MALALALPGVTPHADIVSMNLARYQLSENYALDALGGLGREASAA